MSDIYVFGPNDEENDYSTMGLVCALTPTSAIFKEVAGGESIVELNHPIDPIYGRHNALVRGNILVVPVPVRTTPEIQNGSCVTTVWTYKVKPLNQLTSKNQRTLYKKKTGSSKKKVMKANDVVTVVSINPADARWKVKSKYGTGWINPDGVTLVTQHLIDNNANAIQEIQSPWVVTDQYFRIFKENKIQNGVSIQARHIRYDLLYNKTWYNSAATKTLQEAINGVLNNCADDHDFSGYTNVANVLGNLYYRMKNPIEAFFSPEDGLCKRYGVNMVSDNHELFFLKDPGINRGVRIEYKKNMTGINFTSTDDSVVTRVVPMGEKKDGTDLYLHDSDREQCYVDSPLINLYPTKHVYELKCDGAKVGSKDDGGSTVTTAIARNRMRQQARDLLAEGVDEPKITMEVQFVNLGDTQEYAQFKGLEDAFLFDYIIVKHPDLNIDVTAQIVSITWNVLLDRMDSVTVGEPGETLANSGVTSWQIPNGINGSKIGWGTLGSAALKPDIISARHVQTDSIYTDALQARSIVSEKIAVGAVKADNIDAKAITTDKIDAGAVKADNIDAKAITTDKIAVGAVKADNIDAKAITTDKLAVGAVTADNIKAKTITSDLLVSGIISAGTGLIANGAIVSAMIGDAQIVAAQIYSINADVITAGTLSVERLLLVGADGIVHQINAKSGGISAQQLEEEEYQNKLSGTVIVAKSITAEQIAAGAITTNHLTANSVVASKVDIVDLFANSATINAIKTMTVASLNNGSVLELNESRSVFRTPEFLVEIPGSEDGEEKLRINDEGVYSPNIDSPTVAKRATGGIYRIGASGGYGTLGDALADLSGRVLDGDVWLLIPNSTQTGGALRGVRGGRTVTLCPQNLMMQGGSAQVGKYNGAEYSYASGAAVITSTTGAAYGGIRFLCGRVGDLNLSGRELSFRVDGVSSTGDAVPNIGVMLVSFTGGNYNTSVKSLIWTVQTGTTRVFSIPEDSDDLYLTVDLRVSGANACTVGSTASYLQPRITVGDQDLGWQYPNRSTIPDLLVQGCDRVNVAQLSLPSGVVVKDSNLVLFSNDIYGPLGVDANVSRVIMRDNRGTCTQAVDAKCSQVYVTGLAPSGSYEGWDVDTSTAQISGSGTAPTTQTKNLTANSTGTFSSGNWWTGDRSLRQGYTTSSGRIRGGMWWDFSSIPGTATVTDMKLTLKRMSGFGKGDNVTIKAYGTTSNPRSGTPALTTGPYTLGVINNGQTKTFDVPAQLATDLVKGTVKGVVLYADDTSNRSGKTYSTNYCRIEGTDGAAPKLAVTFNT